MLCYRDMTFCDKYKECSDGKGCHRALTDEVSKGAEDSGLGICQFLNYPSCFTEAASE